MVFVLQSTAVLKFSMCFLLYRSSSLYAPMQAMDRNGYPLCETHWLESKNSLAVFDRLQGSACSQGGRIPGNVLKVVDNRLQGKHSPNQEAASILDIRV